MNRRDALGVGRELTGSDFLLGQGDESAKGYLAANHIDSQGRLRCGGRMAAQPSGNFGVNPRVINGRADYFAGGLRCSSLACSLLGGEFLALRADDDFVFDIVATLQVASPD